MVYDLLDPFIANDRAVWSLADRLKVAGTFHTVTIEANRASSGTQPESRE
jgi:hypothetical protein